MFNGPVAFIMTSSASWMEEIASMSDTAEPVETRAEKSTVEVAAAAQLNEDSRRLVRLFVKSTIDDERATEDRSGATSDIAAQVEETMDYPLI